MAQHHQNNMLLSGDTNAHFKLCGIKIYDRVFTGHD
jgi:hypothetical protein